MQFRILQKAAEKRNRFAKFGLSPFDPLPIANLQLRQACDGDACSPLAASITQCVKGYRGERDGPISRLFKDTAAVIDLSLFSTPESYFRAVSKETDGKHNRSANKARRAGLYTRRIALSSYAQSHFDIKASKQTRSHGAMLEATGVLSRPESDAGSPPPTPACGEHWKIDWGVFNRADDRMWGFATLARSGNVVQLDNMMGHADVLNVGAMKLLQFDMMEWLLNRADPLLAGKVDYLIYGAIEDGGPGAADWRRYLHERPHALHLSKLEELRLPADFDPKGYLALNADVRGSGADPREHYLRHGIVEGRAYKAVAAPLRLRKFDLVALRRLMKAILFNLVLGAAAAAAILLRDGVPLVS